MISSEFYNQFTKLSQEPSINPSGKVSAEVERIHEILQHPTASVQEAREALNEIRLHLSTLSVCQSLSRNFRHLIRDEMKRLSSIQEVAKRTIESTHEADNLFELPYKKQKVDEPLCPLPELLSCDNAYAHGVVESICEEGIVSFYQTAMTKAMTYLEEHVSQDVLEGGRLANLLQEKIQNDKEKDLKLVRIFAHEKELSHLNIDVFSLPTPLNLCWKLTRELIKDQIALIRFIEKRPPLEDLGIGASISPLYSKNRELLFEHFGPLIRELYTYVSRMPHAGNLWVSIKLLCFSCFYHSDSKQVPAFLEPFSQNAPSQILSWQAIGKKVFENTLSELSHEPLHSALQNFLTEMNEDHFKFEGLVLLLSIISVQNELQNLLREGASSQLFQRLMYLFLDYSDLEKSYIILDLLITLKRLKAQGCDNEASNLILQRALDIPAYIGILSERILPLPQQSLQMIITSKEDRYAQEYLLKGGSPSLLEHLKIHGITELPQSFCDKNIIQFFSDKKRVDTFFDRFGALISPSNDLITELLSTKEKQEFILRVIDPYLGDKPLYNQHYELSSAQRVYFALTDDAWEDVEESEIYEIASRLNREEKLEILKKYPADPVFSQYLAEAFSMLDMAISNVPLHEVATEPLIRFLFTKTFQEAKTWLEETLPDRRKRLQTLSDEQKARILSSFPRFESIFPLKSWEELLGVTEEQAKDVVEKARSDVSLHQPLSELKEIDSNDPLNVLHQTMEKFDVGVAPAVVYMLISARVSARVCAGQPYLTWGSAEPASSLSVASDTTPLHTTAGSVYPRGAFNVFSCSFPAVTLRRKIIENENNKSGWIDSLVTALENNDPPDQSQDKEIYYEIRRIAQHLREAYPTLSMDHDTDSVYKRFTSTLQPEMNELEHRFFTSSSFKKDTCFRILLRDLFREICRTPDLKQKIDFENLAHIHGVVFMALFLLVKHSKLTLQPGKLEVGLSPFVRFSLNYLDPQPETPPEDNPGIEPENFWSLKSDYPFHSLTPLTPNMNIPPQTFLALAENVQKLTLEEFYSLCAACVAPQLLSIDADSALDDPRATRFLERIENADPGVKKVLTEDTKLWLNNMATNYVPAMPKKPIPLKVGNKIPFYRDGVADYTPLEKVPEYLNSAGNYASALLGFMKPHNPRLHDGSCGINAFLLGALGLDLKDEKKIPLEALQEMVQDFRKKIVAYARKHKTELEKKFGEEEVKKLIDKYKDMDNPQWATSLVWECAANIYKRLIIVYGCPENPGDTFSIREKGEIEPTAIFQPKTTPKGPPISLLWWESMHYCFLERKAC